VLLQIECRSKPHRNSPQRHLRGLQHGRYQFDRERLGRQVSVLVARSLQGNECLKADGEGARPELLLALSEWP
jgi:hypothetical protein